MKSSELKIPKRPGADRKWTLLFIGDHGNVITLKHFKAIVIGAGLLFILAIVFVAVLLYLNKVTRGQNKEFQKQFSDSEKQIEKLRHEKEILMARLVLAESKTEETPDRDQPDQAKNKNDGRIAEQPPPPKPDTVDTGPKKPPSPPPAKQSPPAVEPRETDQPMSVAVENFKVMPEPGTENLNAQFKIKNTSPDSRRVAGHTVLVLKGNDLQKGRWLVMPAVRLAGDKPTGRRGKRFSIQRFRTMTFSFKAPPNSEQFQTAAVYVFTETGQLLLEQDFAVELPAMPLHSAGSPAAQTPDGVTPPSAAPTREAPAGDQSADPSIEGPPVF